MPNGSRNRRRRATTPPASVPTPDRWAEAWAQYQADIRPAGELQRSLPGCGLPTVSPPPARLPTEEAEQFHCSGCACQTDSTDHRNNREGADFCGECYNERYTSCTACSGEVAIGYDYWSNDSAGPFCEGCYMSAFAHCNGCASECEVDELRDSPIAGDRARYCSGCFTARFTACAGCGRSMLFDDVAYTDEYDGDAYCSGCAPCDEDDDEAEWEMGRRVEGLTFDNIGSERRFGVELEISGCKRHGGLRGKTPFGAKYDGSLSSGKEFVSPVLQGDEGLNAVANLCAYGRDNDWTVDSSCGYHVHIDCSNLNDAQLAAVAVGYAATADVWARFVSKKRAGNTYCDRLPYTAEDIRGRGFRYVLDMTQDRYHWLNWQAYSRHQTVEIRLHSGTTNYEKIANWVKIHTRFVDRLAAMPERDVYELFEGKDTSAKFDAMMELIDDADLRAYYERRAAKHKQPFQSMQPA